MKRTEETINLLVTLDENYLPRLRVLLTSIYLNNPGIPFHIYLLHRRIPQEKLDNLQRGLDSFGYKLFPIRVDETLFIHAPITDRYPQEMYYRLLAAQILPDTLDKILYLDPDILVINSLKPLWETDIDEYLFAAASHTDKTNLTNGVNRIRLSTDRAYFNSGVLLINLKKCRSEIKPQDVFDYVFQHAAELVLPDQDVLNALYGTSVFPLDDTLWNYDARNFTKYRVQSQGKISADWVVRYTAILHFCGREKPWNDNYRRRFGILYRHYMRLTEVYLPEISK